MAQQTIIKYKNINVSWLEYSFVTIDAQFELCNRSSCFTFMGSGITNVFLV